MLLRTTNRVPELAQIPAFRPVQDPVLRRVERLFERRAFNAGEVVIAEGAAGDDVFIIVSGQAVVARCGGELATLGPGDWFGELAALLCLPRNATVRAVTPLRVLVLSKDDFYGVLEHVPDLWRRVAAILARRLRVADGATAGLAPAS